MRFPRTLNLLPLTVFALFLTTLAYADFQAGQNAYDRGDYELALNEWLPLAEQGQADAQVFLGFLYENGQGVPQDYVQAADWYRKAAEQGQPGAQYNLGLLYHIGQGVPQDYAQAAAWFRKAAAQGQPLAQYNLGFLYNHGQGVPQDYVQARKWYRKAAAQGYALAQNNLGTLYNHGQGVPQDYAQAAKWYRKAAAQGQPLAQNNLGALYNHGQGVPQDYAQARKWYRKAAAQGQPGAQNNLGVLYANGWGVSQDYVQAHMWFNLAAVQGQEDARETKEQIAKGMTAEQIAEAQQLAHEWKAKPLQFSKYTLELKKNNTLIHLQGGLGLGVSDDVNELLATHSDVNGIILDSQGGWIHEGRKLVDLISFYGLNTYSLQGCYSACTTAFIAGKKRLLSPSANLGFHQYHVPDFKNIQTDVNIKKEEEQDRKFFQHQDVSAEFLEKLFNTSFDDLWYPPVEEMLTAQVIHGLVNPSDITPIQYGNWSSSDIEKTLLDMPTFHTIKKYDPSTFKKIIDTMDAQVKKGAWVILFYGVKSWHVEQGLFNI